MASLFEICSGDLIGLPTNKSHINVKWKVKGNVLFSFCQKGKALSCHFASDKKGLRYLKEAIEDFCIWAFSKYRWCTMLLAIVKKPSVGRLIEKCGFSSILEKDGIIVYMRERKWAL